VSPTPSSASPPYPSLGLQEPLVSASYSAADGGELSTGESFAVQAEAGVRVKIEAAEQVMEPSLALDAAVAAPSVVPVKVELPIKVEVVVHPPLFFVPW
jgi:hypothetical protein